MFLRLRAWQQWPSEFQTIFRIKIAKNSKTKEEEKPFIIKRVDQEDKGGYAAVKFYP